MSATDPSFGLEEESLYGVLTTYENQVDVGRKVAWQRGKWVGNYPTIRGWIRGYYEDVVKAIRGGDVVVDPQISRDGIRVIELARMSHEKGMTVDWS